MKNFIHVDGDATKDPKVHFPINSQILQSFAGVKTMNNGLLETDMSILQQLKPAENEKALNSELGQNIEQNDKNIFDKYFINCTVFIAALTVQKMQPLPKTGNSDNNLSPNPTPNIALPVNSTNNGLYIFSFVAMNDQTTKELYKYIIRLQSIRKTDFNNAKILFFMKTDHIKDIQNITFEDFASENVHIEDCTGVQDSHDLLYGIDVITNSKNYQIDRLVASSFDSSQLIIQDHE